ncbi:Transposon Tf2-6 poly [Paramuricea clavata]|uniref:Transposon Tf2-6 poly n=1 Tax=Paramuricea clavata TaxID=317549 RepID=A0A6S7KJK6_PARCT|nr:Transposon Tf2-6 poly [Paramuricea clavata]
MVDGYSGYSFVKRLKSLKTGAIVKSLKTWFLDWGFPKFLRSDGGPQFRSEFDAFCTDNNIVHETTSPYNSQSNGKAEATVKSAKKLLRKCSGIWEIFRSKWSEWRNLPAIGGRSPSELLLGRRQRGILPTITITSSPTERKKAATTPGRRPERRELKKLKQGDTVIIQNPITKRWNDEGIVKSIRNNGRSYWIETNNGWVTLRNRRFLRPFNPNLPEHNKDKQVAKDPEIPKPRRSPRLATPRD